jgi:hypothetical protein
VSKIGFDRGATGTEDVFARVRQLRCAAAPVAPLARGMADGPGIGKKRIAPDLSRLRLPPVTVVTVMIGEPAA